MKRSDPVRLADYGNGYRAPIRADFWEFTLHLVRAEDRMPVIRV